MSDVTFRGFNSFTPVLPSGPAAPYTSAPSDYDDDEDEKKKKSGRGSGSGTSIGGLDSNMIKILTEHGLSSDVRYFMELMESVIMSAYDPVTGTTNIAAYKLLLPKLAEIKSEYELFLKAYDKISNDESTMNEVAVTTTGKVYVVNPDAKTPLEYIITKRVGELLEGEVPITNGELARFRLRDPGAAFNTEYTISLENSISMQLILEHIKGAITGLGSTLEKQPAFLNADGTTLKGIEILKNYLAGNATLKTTTSLKSLDEELKQAFNFLVSTLPTNMGVVLGVHARQAKKSPTELLYNYIMSKGNTEVTVDYDIQRGLTPEETGSKVTDNIPLNNAVSFFLGKTPTHAYRISNGTRTSYIGTSHMSNLTDASGKPLAIDSKLSEVLSGEFNGILDTNNITMGQELVYDPENVRIFNSTVESIELPIDQEMLDAENNGFGRAIIRPDLNKLYRVEAAETYIKDNKITDELEINEVYRKNALPPKFVFDETTQKWKIDEDKYIRFAVIHGYADKKAISDQIDSNKDFLLDFNKDQKPLYVDKFQEIRNGKKVGKVPDDIVQGNIFIPIRDITSGYSGAILGAYLSSNTHLTVGQVQALQDAQGQAEARQALGYTKPEDSIASLLNQ